ncbi:MAG TPA: alcohol dehydrogenase-like regulatory protein ErcA [Negativicutes bacterium]|nr:alcohol dehydrogenase-like regulatory protein ErcA [Negativicutes bacterium]
MSNEWALRKFVAPEILFGEGAIDLAGQYAKNLGARRVLLVTDPGVRKAGWVSRVTESLDRVELPYVIFEAVTENPKVAEVRAGAQLYDAAGCNVVVAVGGGSPMDCAKAIGIVASHGRDIEEFEGVDRVEYPIPPLICVPTTAGSSADVSQFAIIADARRLTKMAIVSKAVVPDVALIDPQTLTTLSPFQIACTGMDALTHAIEAYVSTAHSPITDLHAMEAVRLVAANLPGAVAQPLELTFQGPMMLASLEAGLAFSNAILGAVHAMAHSLGGYLDLPHGECNAILLTGVVAFNYASCPDRYDKIAETMGLSLQGLDADGRSRLLVKKLSELRESIGISSTVGRLGVKKSDIPRLAEFAMMDACMATNPIMMQRRDIEELYEAIL